MDKSKLCDFFQEQLEFFDVEFKRLNNGFHFQIQGEHNFYPTKRSYYNTKTGEKCFYPEFESEEKFFEWLDEKTEKTELQKMEKIWNDARHPKFVNLTFKEYFKLNN